MSNIDCGIGNWYQKVIASIVASDLNAIAITAVKQTVVMNKFASVKIEYKSIEEFPEYKNGGVSRYNQTLAFEDTKKGDQDYNDLIVYVNQKMTGCKRL